jgi:hypothetical protein
VRKCNGINPHPPKKSHRSDIIIIIIMPLLCYVVKHFIPRHSVNVLGALDQFQSKEYCSPKNGLYYMIFEVLTAVMIFNVCGLLCAVPRKVPFSLQFTISQAFLTSNIFKELSALNIKVHREIYIQRFSSPVR